MKQIFEQQVKQLIISEMKLLDAERQRKGIKVEWLCSHTGISTRTYSRLKKGNVTILASSWC